jgi:hypothetical protein
MQTSAEQTKKSVECILTSNAEQKNEANEGLLNELRTCLASSFKDEFIRSLSCLIRAEGHFESTLLHSNDAADQVIWSQLEYCINQLKKISKRKEHLSSLIQKLNAFNKELIISKIICSFLLKLYKSDGLACQVSRASELKLISLSLFADLCIYEDIRVQILEDANTSELLKQFAYASASELEQIIRKRNFASRKKSIQNIEKTVASLSYDNINQLAIAWCKMCRLCANLCMTNNEPKLKSLFTNSLFASLHRCVEQCNAYYEQKAEPQQPHFDLLHSLLRFLK